MNTATKDFNTTPELNLSINNDERLEPEMWLGKTTKDVAEVLNEDILYSKDPLKWNDDIADLRASKNQRKGLLAKKAKRFATILWELSQNLRDHSIKRHPKLLVSKKGENLHVESENYFEWDKEHIINTLKKLNTLNQDELDKDNIETLGNWKNSNNGMSWAWLWFIRIARQLRKTVKWNLFKYHIEEDPQNKKIHKLKLDFDFPIPKAA